MINGSVQMAPHCLSSEFCLAAKHLILYVLFHFVAKAPAKNFFKNLIVFEKFLWRNNYVYHTGRTTKEIKREN
ncbi:hypothetical protein DYQ05_06090 [Treponema pedis]|nr:hypothetical protein DYQ05_06090 [Treponema pedis]